MKVGVIGSGGREHALCFSLKSSDKIKQIYCFPGNAGTSSIAKNINIDLNDFEKLKDFIKNCDYPLVIKADGLAAGKGVYICENKNDSILAVTEIFNGKFGLAKNLLVEEFLKGEEMSFFIISDGKTYKVFGTAQDHKRVLEGE